METEQEYKERIYKQANNVKTIEDFSRLLKDIEEYPQQYGHIVYACFAAMKAAFKLVNNGSQGGITGFQASFIAWESIREFMTVKGPLKLLDYDKMLYPQYESNFEKVINYETWDELQKGARELLANKYQANQDVIRHWENIDKGIVPFGYSVKEE